MSQRTRVWFKCVAIAVIITAMVMLVFGPKRVSEHPGLWLVIAVISGVVVMFFLSMASVAQSQVEEGAKALARQAGEPEENYLFYIEDASLSQWLGGGQFAGGLATVAFVFFFAPSAICLLFSLAMIVAHSLI